MTTVALVPWDGGRANVTAGLAERATQAKLPMTKLTKGSGRSRFSADGQYHYVKSEHCGWRVQHVPTGQWITELAGLDLVGFRSLADARRWTYITPEAAEMPKCPCGCGWSPNLCGCPQGCTGCRCSGSN